MKYIYTALIALMFSIHMHAAEYHSNVRPAFEEYQQVEQPYSAPYKAPIDWNSLDYDDAIWGWYYKQLWWLYHPNSGETPPWLIPSAPIGDGIWFLFVLSLLYALCSVRWKQQAL